MMEGTKEKHSRLSVRVSLCVHLMEYKRGNFFIPRFLLFLFLFHSIDFLLLSKKTTLERIFCAFSDARLFVFEEDSIKIN